MGESVGRMGSRFSAVAMAVGVVALVISGSSRHAEATLKYGPLQVSGNFETQNLIRHPDLEKWQFVQNRNTFRLRVDWDWLEKQRLIDRYDIPFIERSKLYILYRGVYDGFYDIAPSDRQVGQTRYDDLVGGRITDLSGSRRKEVKFENRLREAYVDLKLKDVPVSFRIGRQQVIWGESDQFRLMDIWNPLDVSWHFQQESWDNIRVPLWLGKGLWDIGTVGPFSNTFVEVVYNPFDFQPGVKAAFLPYPWALPFPAPLRPGQAQYAVPTSVFPLITPVFDLQGTSFKQGDFDRTPGDASEVGARVHSVTPQGLEFAINYIYGRGRGVGAASPFGVRIESLKFRGTGPIPFAMADPSLGTFGGQRVSAIDVSAEVVHPYLHIFGLTGNYFEGDFLQTVLRFETAYAMDEPHQTVEESKRVLVTDANGNPVLNLDGSQARSPLGFTKRDIWSGMIGFDRPTWIRWLNSKSTWFLTGQFFWHYTLGDTDVLRGAGANAGEAPYSGNPENTFPGVESNGIGVWRGGPYDGQVERLQNGAFAGNSDKVQQWEHLITIAGTSFYRGGTIVPFVANAWDPVNQNNETLWYIDYFYTNNVIFRLEQKFFTSFNRKFPSNDPWFAGGRFHRRDETGVKVTFQF
jgi:hypothetical protein